MPNDLHYFMFFVGRLFQGAEMMIRHSEYIEADESNLMYDFVAAREATREALKDVKEFLEKISGPGNLAGSVNFGATKTRQGGLGHLAEQHTVHQWWDVPTLHKMEQ